MKIRIKNLVIATFITIIIIVFSLIIQHTYYNISLKYKIKKEIRNEFKKFQQERIEKLRKHLKSNQRKC